MENENTYYIPVDLIKHQTFKINAKNQREAINQLTAFLKESEATNNMFTGFKIKETEIDCDQDEEIIEEVIKDFNLKTKEGHGIEYVTHKIAVDKFTEPSTESYKTYSSFNGSDVIWLIGDRMIGSVNGIKFDTTKNDNLEIIFTVFTDMEDHYEYLTNLKHADIHEFYLNEFGQKMIRKYEDVSYLGEKNNTNVETRYIETSFIFKMNKKPSIFKIISDEDWNNIYSPMLHIKTEK